MRALPYPHTTGFTLVELIAFIVIMGIVGSVVLIPLNTMLRDSAQNDQQTVAMMLAGARMDIRLGERAESGVGIFPDGYSSCTTAVCTATPPPAGYSVTTHIATGWSSSSNYKIITVQALGEKAGQGTATLSMLLADY